MDYVYFVGIDVSKDSLDLSIVKGGKVLCHTQCKNAHTNIRLSVNQLLEQNRASFSNTLFCIENTGIYHLPVLNWLHSSNAKVWMESAVQISKCLGLTRGKNDKQDSARIALYAYANGHMAGLWKVPSLSLQKLSVLLSQRKRLIKAKKQLKTAFVEQALFFDAVIMDCIKIYTTTPVTLLDQQINQIEKDIVALIKSDDNLYRLYRIIMSIDGVGFVTAAYVIVTTNAFTDISVAKKYACYAGVVPFEYLSGSSLRGKSRISQKANKTIKTLLHMSALAAIRVEGDLKSYYLRKVGEGKNKMSVLNAVRNKIVLRIFACVKRGKPYQKQHQKSMVKDSRPACVTDGFPVNL